MIIDDKDMISDGANSLHLISDAIYYNICLVVLNCKFYQNLLRKNSIKTLKSQK